MGKLIPKYQFGGNWNYVQVTPAEQFTQRVLDNVHELKNQAIRMKDVSTSTRKSNVAKVQNELYKKGYFGKIDYNKAVDGLWGKKTEAAYQKALKDGYENQNGKLIKVERIIPRNRPLDRKGNYTKECAGYVNGELQRNNIPFWGNSYDIGGNDVEKVVNGYDGLNKPTDITYTNLANFQHNAADNLKNQFDSSQLNKNDIYVVNMYYNHGSKQPRKDDQNRNGVYDFSEKALANGQGVYGTHEGLLYYDNNKGWRISHNIHGTVYNDSLDRNTGSKNNSRYAVTAIYKVKRPLKKKLQKGGIIDEVTVTAINPNIGENKEDKEYIRGINSMRNDIMQKYNLTDKEYADLAKQAYNIAGVESTHGNGISYNIRKLIPDELMHLAKKLHRGKDSPNSRGLSQIKFYENDPLNKKYEQYGITEENTKGSPYNQGRATVIKFAHINDHLKDYHWKDGTPISDEDARIIIWNRGHLTDYKNDRNGSAAGYVKRYKKYSKLK